MRIGEVSRILGVSSSAIRFYERHGLIKSASISRSANGYREYGKKEVEEIRFIVKLKAFGLELNEIKSLLSEESKSCGDLVSSLDQQLEKCREMEQLIKNRISSLMQAKKSCQSACKPTRRIRKCCATDHSIKHG